MLIITIEEFINFCKENDIEKIKEIFEQNKMNIKKLIKNCKNKYCLFLNLFEELHENNKKEIIEFIFNEENGIINYVKLFDYACENNNIKIARIIYHDYIKYNMDPDEIENNEFIYYCICEIYDSPNLNYLKIVLQVIDYIYDISKNDDYFLRQICFYGIKKEKIIEMGIRINNVEKYLEIIKFILDEYIPNYNLSAIKTIKKGIIHCDETYPIIKYLTEYIYKRKQTQPNYNNMILQF